MNRRQFLYGLASLPIAAKFAYLIPEREMVVVEDVLPALTSASLAHLATIYYNRAVLDRLAQTFRFAKLMDDEIPFPKRAGRSIEFHRYSPLSAV